MIKCKRCYNMYDACTCRRTPEEKGVKMKKELIYAGQNILDAIGKPGIICQQVNCQGVMGSGVAKAIREKLPGVYKNYLESLKIYGRNGMSALGKVSWWYDPDKYKEVAFIASIFGQQFFGKDGMKYTSYDALDCGFEQVGLQAVEEKLPVHVPLIGAGLGGGNWNVIKEIILHRCKDSEVYFWGDRDAM